MSTKDKKRRATTAAEAALAAAAEAKKLSKTLPEKQARKLAPLITDAKKAGAVTKKQLEDKPRRIERSATDAILALADATAKIEQRLVKKADMKKADAKKSDLKKPDVKKTDVKKTDVKKTDVKKTDVKKTDVKKTDAKKSDLKKSDLKKSDLKKSDVKKKKKKGARKKKSAPIPAVPSAVVGRSDLPHASVPGTTESREHTAVVVDTGAILQRMTVASLRARAKAEGRIGYSRLTKAELIALFA